MPLGDALRSGSAGASTQVGRDRGSVYVEHLGELRNRGAALSLGNQIVYLGGVDSRPPLKLKLDAFGGSSTAVSGMIRYVTR